MSLSSRVNDLAAAIGTALQAVRATANAAYVKPSSGIPKSDQASDVQASLGKADTAVQQGTASSSQVYGKNSSGTQTGLPYTASATANQLALRNANGGVTVPTTPTDTGDAAPKGYVDTGLSGKAATSHTHTLSQISDAGPTGRSLAASASAMAARNVIGAVGSIGGVTPDTTGYVENPMTAATRLALSGATMVSQGHSFVAGSGITSPNKWAEQFAAFFNMVYPTSTGSSTTGDLMRAVAGSSAEEASQRAFGGGSAGYKWRIGDRYPLLLQCLINTSRRTGSNAAARAGALHCVRGMVALASSKHAYLATDTTFFTYSTSWTTSTVSTSMSKTVYTIGTSASDAVNVTFTMPEPGKVWALILSRNASLPGNVMQVYNMTKGVELFTFNNTNTSASDTPGTYITIPVEVRAEPGDVIRLRAPASTRLGNFAFDGLLVAQENPGPVFLLKEPYLNDYSLSTQYPNGSDATFDYFNVVHDQVAAEFGNVVVGNPNTAGYWDKTTMIQSDGVHPNLAGSTALAQTLRDAVLQQAPGIIARKALGVAV